MSRFGNSRSGATASSYSARSPYIHRDEFPLLSFRELSECLQECLFDASEELVTRPSGPYLRKLFEQILDAFLGLSSEYCRITARHLARNTNATSSQGDADKDAGDNDEIDAEESDTADALVNVVFFSAVRMFLSKCGIHDFTLMDLIRPDPLRTQRVLSAVINFARFREVRLQECDSLAEDAEDALQEIRTLDEKKVDMENRIEKMSRRLRDNEAASTAEADAPERAATLAQYHKYNSKLEQELIKLQKSQEIFKKEHTSYKETKAQLIEKLEDQHSLLGEAERELQKVEACASADPAAFKQAVTDLKVHSQEAEQSLKHHELLVRNKTKTQNSINTVEDELRNAIKVVQEITNDVKSFEYANENLARQTDELANKTQASKELDIHLERVKRQFKKSEEKISKLRQQALEREQSAAKRFHELEAEYDELTKDREIKHEKMDVTRREIAKIEAEIAKIELDFEYESNAAESAVAKLNAHIRQYIEEMSRHL